MVYGEILSELAEDDNNILKILVFQYELSLPKARSWGYIWKCSYFAGGVTLRKQSGSYWSGLLLAETHNISRDDNESGRDLHPILAKT